MGKLGLCHKRKDHLCKRESAVAHSFENIISVLIMNAFPERVLQVGFLFFSAGVLRLIIFGCFRKCVAV